jgi:SAM-dependent methyltransferase
MAKAAGADIMLPLGTLESQAAVAARLFHAEVDVAHNTGWHARQPTAVSKRFRKMLTREDLESLPLYEQVDHVINNSGLIEHFAPDDTRQAVCNHFRLLRPGGILILTFPTPTLLYRATRTAIEAVGQWQFPDERPLMPEEVAAAIAGHGRILYRQTLWPLLLTQELMVVRNEEAASR